MLHHQQARQAPWHALYVHRADDNGDAWILEQHGQLECEGLSACNLINVSTDMRCWVHMHGHQAVKRHVADASISRPPVGRMSSVS